MDIANITVQLSANRKTIHGTVLNTRPSKYQFRIIGRHSVITSCIWKSHKKILSHNTTNRFRDFNVNSMYVQSQ